MISNWLFSWTARKLYLIVGLSEGLQLIALYSVYEGVLDAVPVVILDCPIDAVFESEGSRLSIAIGFGMTVRTAVPEGVDGSSAHHLGASSTQGKKLNYITTHRRNGCKRKQKDEVKFQKQLCNLADSKLKRNKKQTNKN